MTTPAACGGEGALKKLASGQKLAGLAALSQKEVESELDQDGRAAIVKRAAVRLEAVARLFYNAILSAADRGDLKALALYSQRFAWLQSRALGAWEQLRKEETGLKRGATARDVLDAIRSGDDGDQ